MYTQLNTAGILDRPQRKTLDDMVMKTIGGDPALRREWAETRLQQIKRNGRSEMDIVGEGLDMVLKMSQDSEGAA